MSTNEPLYLFPETLYRIGKGTDPTLTAIRPHEISIIHVNGIAMIVADGRGVSLYNKSGLELAPLTGWAWEIKAFTRVPPGLKLIRDPEPEGHYTLCPVENMTLSTYIGLLEKLVIHCTKAFKKKA
jgi:hypothetical protein